MSNFVPFFLTKSILLDIWECIVSVIYVVWFCVGCQKDDLQPSVCTVCGSMQKSIHTKANIPHTYMYCAATLYILVVVGKGHF